MQYTLKDIYIDYQKEYNNIDKEIYINIIQEFNISYKNIIYNTRM